MKSRKAGNKPSLIKHRGIALIQVIITTSVIMLLTIFFLSVAKSQVDRASALQDKTQAYLASYSAKNQVLYGLLTEDFAQLRGRGWNFHGKPFAVSEFTTVALQDLNGLFSLITMTDESMLLKLLKQQLDDRQATTIAASMMDWVDRDNIARSNGAEQAQYPGEIEVRNARIQTFTELIYIQGMTVEAEQVLIENTTFQPTRFYNPMTSPQVLLEAYSGNKSIATQVNNLKQQSDYSRKAVELSSGIEVDEGVDYIIGPSYRLTVDTVVGDSYVGKVLEYQVFPYRKAPLESLSNTPRSRPVTNN